MNFPDPRKSPPPVTGFRPGFVRKDEWLTYAFGYDDKETDDWIVPRNASDMIEQPLWIGSKCRSLFAEERKVFKRHFSHDQRYAEFRLAWQDPEEPLLVHDFGGFQVDREFYSCREKEYRLRPSIYFEPFGNEILIYFENETTFSAGSPYRSNHGRPSYEVISFLAHKVLGKTIAEILVLFLHQDEKIRRIIRNQAKRLPDPPPSRPAVSADRDLYLYHAWDNQPGARHLYSNLNGRLGMYNLPS